jgi:hypothetical protein
VGLSHNPKQRLRTHKQSGVCKAWLRELKTEGYEPILELPLGELDYGSAMAAEQRLTAMQTLMYPGRLLNANNRVYNFFGPLSPISEIYLKGGLLLSPI